MWLFVFLSLEQRAFRVFDKTNDIPTGISEILSIITQVGARSSTGGESVFVIQFFKGAVAEGRNLKVMRSNT